MQHFSKGGMSNVQTHSTYKNKPPQSTLRSVWRRLYRQTPCLLPVCFYFYFAVFRMFLGITLWAVGV